MNWNDLAKNAIVGAVIIGGMVILAIIAVRLDGAVALTIVGTINQVVLGGMTVMGGMKVIEGTVSFASNRAQARVAIAQAQAHAQVAAASVQAGVASPVPPPAQPVEAASPATPAAPAAPAAPAGPPLMGQ